MTHPTIHHLDDVLPHIAGRDEFVHAQRDGYSVIDYNYVLPDSFDDPMRLECRGIKFAPDGSVLARPLHKFHNIGERPDTQPHLLPFHEPHIVTEKMDGSMIHPAIVDGELVFMTRMGRTDHARAAERHLTVFIREWCMANPDLTPIFEWTAPDNRIVVPYEKSTLTLLAIRENVDGGYGWPESLDAHAADMDVPLVRTHTTPRTAAEFLEHARSIRGMEGFVVRFASGLWVKAKGEDYVLKHKAKDSVLQEKNVLALVLRGELDDVLPLLDAGDREEIVEYQVRVTAGVEDTARSIDAILERRAGMDQKTFALDIAAHVPTHLRPLAFQVRAGKDAREAVVDTILKNVGSQSAVDKVRPLFGAVFGLGGNVELAEAA